MIDISNNELQNIYLWMDWSAFKSFLPNYVKVD